MFGRRPFLTTLVAILAVTSIGIAGFTLIEGYSLLDAVYMTVITLSTVGFREVVPLSAAGKVLTIFLIVFGFGLVVTIVGSWTRGLIEGELRDLIDRRRMERMLAEISDHFIVCGYGRFGVRLVRELQQRGLALVVIDREREVVHGVLAIRAEATDEDVLKRAGIERAKGLLTTLSSDADNLYITITAHELNPELIIVSRCESEVNERRLLSAGATRTVSSYEIGGHRMAQAALHPRVLDFVDMVTDVGDKRMSVGELVVSEGSPIVGIPVRAAGLAECFGVVVLGVVPKDGLIEFGQTSSRALEAGDILLTFGDEESIGRVAMAISEARE
ncbi:MAG: NAD-binding protein [Candidatus Tectomicrobia bacterium]|nr:NAD-binding protein [Candidatus Tectomicrobia bacterium]